MQILESPEFFATAILRLAKQLIEEFHAITTCAEKHCVYDVGSIRSSREETWLLFQTVLWLKAHIEISATWP
jgi:hypothetical protein